jgi:hypothetical protein
VLPSGAIIQPLAGENLGDLEPHFLQKALPKVLGSSIAYSPTISLPESHLNCSAFTNRLVANAAPVTFLQREHWHIPKNS